MREVVISGTGLFTPAESISNEELVESLNAFVVQYNEQNADEIAAGRKEKLEASSTDFVEKASGIKARYVMEKSGILDINRMRPRLPLRGDEQPSVQSEMAVSAAQDALSRAGRKGSEVDCVLVACSNMQRAYPAIAVEVQDLLGAKGWGYDMNVACSSATFGIQAAVDSVARGSANVALVVSPEITTGHNNFQNRDAHFIFGDGCTAVVVEAKENMKTKNYFDVIGTKLQTKFSNNIRNNFGFLNESEVGEREPWDLVFKQNGRKVFKEVCPMVAEHIEKHLAEHQLSPNLLRRMWLHQANLNMNQLIARKVLGRDPDALEAPVILNEYANTSSAGSVIAFHKYQDDLNIGDVGIICSFGAGYSIGSVIVRKQAA